MASTIPPPDYVLLTEPSREALLSQWGVTQNTQRELFHKLCGLRRADIDPSPWNKNDLEGLMIKLRDAKVGLLTTKRGPEGRKVDKIVLTDEASPRFWYYFLSEVYQAGYNSSRTPYLKAQALQAKGWLPSEQFLLKLEADAVSRQLLSESMEKEMIFSFPLSREEIAIVSAKDYPFMISACFQVLRLALQHQGNQVAVSRLLKSNLNELNRHLNQKEAIFWKILTQALVSNKQDLLGDPRQKWEPGVFHAAHLLGGMVDRQLQEAQKERDDDREKDADMKALVQTLLQAPESSMSPEEVHAALGPLKAKYGDQFNAFVTSFETRYTKSDSSTGLPPVVIVDDTWIHRDKLYHYFVRHWDRLRVKVRSQMIDRLHKYIRTGNKDQDTAFAQAEAFEAALRDEIEKEDQEIAWMLKRPRILAEAAIALKKEVAAAQPLLERFFKPGTMFFKRLSLMLELDPEELFASAITRLSWVNQIFLFLSGKRTAYLNQILSLAPRTKPPVAPAGSSAPAALTNLRDDDEPEGTGGVAQRRRPRTPPPPKPKTYSEKEKNKAWTDFAQNLRKK